MKNNQKKFKLISAGAAAGLIITLIPLTLSAQQTWHAASGFSQPDNTDQVKVRKVATTANTLTFQYSLPTARLKNSSTVPSASRIEIGSAPQHQRAGEPNLPVIPVQIVLPSGTTLENAIVTTDNAEETDGSYLIEHGQKPIPLNGSSSKTVTSADAKIYESDDPYPSEQVEVVGVYKKRGITIAVLNLFPVTYHPKSGKITTFKTLTLKITTKSLTDNNGLIRVPSVQEQLFPSVENPEDLDSYRKGASANEGGIQPLGICNPNDSYRYVIVTADSFATATTDVTVRDLIAQKQARGISATIVTIETVIANYTGTDNAVRLRNFITDAYTNWETEYVLLGGDINIIPMRKLYCNGGGEIDEIPSDLYYQCLDGNYNSDNDSYWGETTDGPGGSDVDLMAEVFVGRASAETKAEMSNFVYKTLAYENAAESSPYLRKAMMVGEELGFGGVSEYATASMEEIRLGSSEHNYTTAGFASSPLFTVDTLYDRPDYSWPASQIISRMNSNNYGIYNHLGHANATYVMKFYNSDADALTNTNPFFAYSQGCIPGNFEVDCIAEHLTTSHRRGAFAVVFNARYGWGQYNSTDGPSQRFDRQFWDAYFSEYMINLGALNADSHEDNLWDINGDCIRWCYYETNLLGDPQTPIRGLVNGPMIQYSSHTFNDNSGNGDGLINPGEHIDVLPSLTNVGSENATGVTMTLSTTDSYVTMTDNSASAGNIACCGAVQQALDNISFNVSSSCPTPHTIPFTLTIRDNNGGEWTSQFSMTVYTSSQISGYVRSLASGAALANATVYFTGPLNGTVTTDASGHYLFGGIDGTYNITAVASGYLQSSSVTVTLPPSRTNINFNLILAPDVTVTPVSFSKTLSAGSSTTDVMTITNTGGDILTYAISVADVTAASQIVSIAQQSNNSPDSTDEDWLQLPTTFAVPESNGGLAVTYPFFDGFESGNWNNWTAGSGSYTRTVTNTTAASGSYSFTMTGGNSTHFDGITAHFTSGQSPTEVSFAVRTNDPDGASGYFVMDSDGSIPVYLYMNQDGLFRVNGSSTFSYQPNVWYHIRFQIDWSTHTLNFFVDGTLVASNIAFSSNVNSFNTIYLYNYYSAQAWWDDINIGGAPVSNWLTVSPITGSVAPGASAQVQLEFNSANMNGGNYQNEIRITTNAPGHESIIVPANLTVDGMPRLSITPMQYTYPSTWIGARDTATFTLVNAGNEPTVISSVTSGDPLFTPVGNFPLTIPAFGEMILTVVFHPTTIGTYSTNVTFTSNAEDNPTIQVSLSGTATSAPAALLEPRELTFNLQPSSAPADQTSALMNVGGASLSYVVGGIRELSSPLANFKPKTVPVVPAIRYDLIYDEKNYENEFVPGRIIVAFKEGKTGLADASLTSAVGVTAIRNLAMARNPSTGKLVTMKRQLALYSIEAKDRAGVLKAIEVLRYDANVAFVEPDYVVKAIGIPNDPSFSQLYGMHNSGQTGGTTDADIDAPEAWDVHTGSQSILIGVIDTGIDYVHPDLVANIWTNPGEIPNNNIDDDGNGFIDDIHGWDFANDDNNPTDGHGHGTHCSGTIAGNGNNGIGVAGVMWRANLVALKFLSDGGSGSTTDAIDAVNYAAAMDISITSNSWGGGGFSQALMDAIATQDLFIAAAGNNGTNNDTSPHYPSSYNLDNIIAVAATDHNDALASFSCYGAVSVDLGAPGVNIYSCAPGSSYQSMSGTSMATPHVSGAAGLLWTYNTMLTALEVKQILLSSTDPKSSLNGKTVTGGRLNIEKALDAAGPSWLSVSPTQAGVLAPGNELEYTVTVTPQGLAAGVWRGAVLVNTNDPLKLQDSILVTANIGACRSLSASSNTIDFESVWVGATATRNLILTNSCNSSVTISALTITGVGFESGLTAPVTVPAFGTVTLPVTFAPSDAHYYTGQLTITSNAGDNPTIRIDLAGTCVRGPDIAITPTSFNVSLTPDATTTRTLMIGNTGGADVEFELQIDDTQANTFKAKRAAAEAIKSSIVNPNAVPLFSNDESVWPKTMPCLHNVNPMANNNILIFRDNLAWGYDVNVPLLTGMGANVSTASSSQMASIDLEQFDVIIFESQQPQSFYNSYNSSRARFEQFLNNGGIISFHTATYSSYRVPNLTLPGGMRTLASAELESNNMVNDSAHPLVQGSPATMTGSYASHEAFQNLPGNAHIIVVNSQGHPTTVEYKVGRGLLLATGMTWEWGYSSGSSCGTPILSNALAYVLSLKAAPQWLTADQQSGTVVPGGTDNVILSFNSTGLAMGTYSAEISISHNSPLDVNPLVIPVTLVVNENGGGHISSITSIGISATVKALGNHYSLSAITLGAPVVGTLQGNSYKLSLW